MKTKFFLALSAIALVTSCSNDEVIEMSDSNAIKFSVSSGKMSRAANVYCSNNLPTKFNVWATLTTTGTAATTNTYITNDEIEDKEGVWTNNSGNRYWPNDGTLNFYAHCNATTNSSTFTWPSTHNTTSAPTVTFNVADYVGEQQDFLYAVATDQSKTTNATNGVALNFRHALSQVVFQAKNVNPNLYVEIYGVSVCNVGKTGTFTYPTTSTATPYVNHTDGQAENKGNVGTWANMSDKTMTNKTQSYNIGWNTAKTFVGSKSATPSPLYVDADKYTDSDGKEQSREFSKDAMLLLPQSTTAWVPSTEKVLGNATGSYFKIKCNIYNVAGDSYVSNSDVLLWGTAGTGKELAIPVGIAWEPGKKYIYTFVFGDGDGGWDPNPDPDDDDEDVEPVLTPIKFTVSVDDFDPVTQPDVKVETTTP